MTWSRSDAETCPKQVRTRRKTLQGDEKHLQSSRQRRILPGKTACDSVSRFKCHETKEGRCHVRHKNVRCQGVKMHHKSKILRVAALVKTQQIAAFLSGAGPSQLNARTHPKDMRQQPFIKASTIQNKRFRQGSQHHQPRRPSSVMNPLRSRSLPIEP